MNLYDNSGRKVNKFSHVYMHAARMCKNPHTGMTIVINGNVYHWGK